MQAAEFLDAVARNTHRPPLNTYLRHQGFAAWYLPEGRLKLVAEKLEGSFTGVVILIKEVNGQNPIYLWRHLGTPLWCKEHSKHLDMEAVKLVAGIIDKESMPATSFVRK